MAGGGLCNGGMSSLVSAFGSSFRAAPTTAGCVIGGPGGVGLVAWGADTLDPDGIVSDCSATAFLDRRDVESTGVTLGVGSGLLVTH